jgi:hypothetical protein
MPLTSSSTCSSASPAGATNGVCVVTSAALIEVKFSQIASRPSRRQSARVADGLRLLRRPSVALQAEGVLAFRITAELQARARTRAKREGKTVSEIARHALEHYVK